MSARLGFSACGYTPWKIQDKPKIKGNITVFTEDKMLYILLFDTASQLAVISLTISHYKSFEIPSFAAKSEANATVTLSMIPAKPYLILFIVLFGSTLSLSAQDDYKVAAVGFYNLENLFDTIDNPAINDEDFLPNGRLQWNGEKYASKQANMAKVISQLATELTPDGVAVLGVAEIENRLVLEDLVKQPELAARHYQVVQYDSPDERGIDCGLLYNPKYFTLFGSRALPVGLKDSKTGIIDYTRDILLVSGQFEGEMVHFMVGHWPSRRGGEAGSAWMRAAAASVCKQASDSLQAIDPNAKIIIMGDLNDDPDSKSLTNVLKARRKADDVDAGELYNPMYDLYKSGNGTMAYRDAWSLFDQMIVSKAFVNKKTGGWQLYKAIVFRQPWLIQAGGQYAGYPFRTFVGDIFLNGYSDHLPVYLYFLKKK